MAKELCDHDFSASAISRMNKTLDEELKRIAERQLEVEYPYLVLDARYEKVRVDGVTHEDWIEAHRYLNMTHLRDHLKSTLQSEAA